jgi:hypothetical protein
MKNFFSISKFTSRTYRQRISLHFVLAVLIFSTLYQSTALALDVNFYSGNDILYYDPEACTVESTSGNVAVVGNDNAEKIFNFLTTTSFKGTGGKPFNAVQAAGALGNFQQESTMNPAAVEPNGAGHGLAQWSFDRWAKLQSLASSEGKEWSDIAVQLKMIQNELNDESGYSGEGSRLLAASEFATVTDPAKASYIFQLSYERAGDPMQANRNSAAQAYYTQFKDKAPSSTAASTSTSSGAKTCASSGAASGNFATNFTFYNQCDAPWGTNNPPTGTVCYNACGPTSTAMVITNMTGQKVTPLDTTDYVTANKMWLAAGGTTGGTSFDTNVKLAEKWGLKGSVISAQQSQDITYIKKALDGGGLVMVAGYGANPYYGDAAHFILIRAIDADGKILIANPAPHNAEENTRHWDAGDIINGSTFGGVVFTK